MDTLLKDIRYALRWMARSPGFSAVAILSLGLGVGVNTAMLPVAVDRHPIANAGSEVRCRMAQKHEDWRVAYRAYTLQRKPLWHVA